MSVLTETLLEPQEALIGNFMYGVGGMGSCGLFEGTEDFLIVEDGGWDHQGVFFSGGLAPFSESFKGEFPLVSGSMCAVDEAQRGQDNRELPFGVFGMYPLDRGIWDGLKGIEYENDFTTKQYSYLEPETRDRLVESPVGLEVGTPKDILEGGALYGSFRDGGVGSEEGDFRLDNLVPKERNTPQVFEHDFGERNLPMLFGNQTVFREKPNIETKIGNQSETVFWKENRHTVEHLLSQQKTAKKEQDFVVPLLEEMKGMLEKMGEKNQAITHREEGTKGSFGGREIMQELRGQLLEEMAVSGRRGRR